jgi:hypothetical protein
MIFLTFSTVYIFQIKSLHIKLMNCTFTYLQSLSKFWKHQMMISITVCCSERSDVNYTRMPSCIYQDVINLIVACFSARRNPVIFMNVAMREHCILYN